MRALLALILAAPAQAWEFTPAPVCTLFDSRPDFSVRVTYDPAQPEAYAIILTRPDPWPETDRFGLRFNGPRSMTLGTDQHRLSADGKSLTVTDTGFGNVLDGLEFNATATALAGATEVAFDLTDAAEAVREFRACGVAPSA
jgi:hypothetical protein